MGLSVGKSTKGTDSLGLSEQQGQKLHPTP